MASLDTTLEHLTSEAALVEQASGGVTLAFDELHRRHAPAAWAYAVAVSGDATVARAAVADGFAMVFSAVSAARIDAEVPFRQYLLMATRNSLVDRLASAPPRSDRAGDPIVASAFARVPERWRSVLWLRVVEGLRLGATAAVVKLPTEQAAHLADRAAVGVSEQYLTLHARLHRDATCDRAMPRLLDFVSGALDDRDSKALVRHLAVCAPCTVRHQTLDTLDTHLAALAPPMPEDQAQRSAASWVAAVSPAPTGTGLSPLTEKVLAVVSASAAAAAIFTAAVQVRSSNGSGTAALGPIVGQMASPVPLELPAGILLQGAPDSGIGEPDSGGVGDSEFGAGARRISAGDTVRGGSTPTAPADGSVVPGSGTPGTPGTPTSPTAPGGPGEPTTPGGPSAPNGPTIPLPDIPLPTPDGPPPPTVNVGADVGEVPVAVEVGPKPGLTVGPITIGSAPSPTQDLVSVDGPLKVLDPVLAPVNAVLGGLLG